MGPVSPPPPPQQQQQQQQQQRRWRHAHERVASFSRPSEVIRFPARPTTDHPPSSPFRKLLILPGNPGASSFYLRFAEALSDELGGATEIVALSFHGHETIDRKSAEKGGLGRRRSPPLDLDGQVEHAAAFLERLLSEVDDEHEREEEEEREKNKKRKGRTGARGGRERSGGDGGPLLSVAVVGHSIGGTVAALAVREVEERRRRQRGRSGGGGREGGGEALRALSPPPSSLPSPLPSPLPPPPAPRPRPPAPPRAKIAAVCAMMPYVAFDEGSAQQRALRALAATPLARAAACLGARALGAALPRGALAALVGLATPRSAPLTRHARETVADFARAGGLDHALHLAHSEFRALSAGSERGGVPGSPSGKFSVARASEIWEPLASLGRRASVFAVGGRAGGGGSGSGSGGEGGGDGKGSGERGGSGDGKKEGDGGGDHWCPAHHLDRLRARAPWMRLELDPTQRHDFVVCDERTARAAKAVAGLLRETAADALAAAAGDDGGARL